MVDAAISVASVQNWRSSTFAGSTVRVDGYRHNPEVELDVQDLLVADFAPTPDETGTDFLLVALDRENLPDAGERLLRAIEAVHG